MLPWGSYDGIEIRELVGLFILKNLGKALGNKNIGLYRDDGLAVIKNKSARLADKTRKELHKTLYFIYRPLYIHKHSNHPSSILR